MDNLYNKQYTIELYVKQFEYEVESKKLIRFLWKSESSESRTKDTQLYPGLKKHKIDEDLVLHHVFKEGQNHLTHFKAFDVTDPGKEVLLGECEIDLTKLIKVTNPFKFNLLSKENKRMSLHAYVTAETKPLTEDPKTFIASKSGLSSKKDDYLSLNKSLGLTLDGSYAHSNVSVEEEIYDKINKMSLKLSRIEKEILKKTFKLNMLNKENVEEMTKIKTKLEKDIKRKDLQIKILINQLDELHSALALSHQRELELSEEVEYTQFPEQFYDSLNVTSGDKPSAPKQYLGESGFGYNKSIINELETNINDLSRFKQDYESLNDPGKKITHLREILGNLEKIKKIPKYLSTNSSSSSSVKTWKEYTSGKMANVLEKEESGSVRRDVLSKPLTSLKESVGRGVRMARDRVPLNNSSVLEGIKLTKSELKPEVSKSAQALTRSKRLGMSKTGLISRVGRPEGKEVPMAMHNGGIFIPKIEGNPSKGIKRGNSLKSGSGSTERGSTVCGLEKELVVTKVKLADSETTKEEYIKELRGHGVIIMS